MARVWFLVTVLIHIVLANENEIRETCDSCMRTGGNWCKRAESDRCSHVQRDDICAEPRPTITSTSVSGKIFNPVFSQRTLDIGETKEIELNYISPVELKVNLVILNTTQNLNIDVTSETKCISSACTVTIKAKPNPSFCTHDSSTHEFVFVKLHFENSTEEPLVKYHIPCACECSRYVEKNSVKCNGKGNFACGACISCQKGWGGEYCQDKIGCGPKRGDNEQCTHSEKDDVKCSGNGYCGHCDTCVCYTDRKGSQYFDENEYCEDICMVSSKYHDCFKNNTIGKCQYHGNTITVDTLNKTLLHIFDESKRFVWVECNVTVDECNIEYAAMRTRDNENHVMVLKRTCNNPIADSHTSDASVPIILSVLGLLAVVLTAAGLLVWKHLHALPPPQLADSEYQNIGAEDCTGENPIYKSPMSSFKNPTYGKW